MVFAERVGEIATSARFDSFYHALLISQRELSRQDERFAARFHRFARVVRDADIVENQPTNPIRFFRREIRLAKDRSDVGLRRVPLFRRPKRPRRVASLPTMKTRFTNVLRVKI